MFPLLSFSDLSSILCACVGWTTQDVPGLLGIMALLLDIKLHKTNVFLFRNYSQNATEPMYEFIVSKKWEF